MNYTRFKFLINNIFYYIDLDSNFTKYSRRTLTCRINDDFIKINDAIKKLFKLKQLLVTTTADIWST